MRLLQGVVEGAVGGRYFVDERGHWVQIGGVRKLRLLVHEKLYNLTSALITEVKPASDRLRHVRGTGSRLLGEMWEREGLSWVLERFQC